MILKQIYLNNIRSYVEETITFPSGSVLLAGDIGAGKSTILQAMEFALFGLEKGAGESLLRKGSRQGNVELTFEIEGKEYKIKRALKIEAGKKKKKAGAFLFHQNL